MSEHHTGHDPEQGGEEERPTSRWVPPNEAVTGGFSGGADFITYIVAGLLIGLLLDRLFGTSPWFTIIWSLGGFGVGFYRMWQRSAVLEEGENRGHGV